MSDTPKQLFQKWLTSVKLETQYYNKLVGEGGASRTTVKKQRETQYTKWKFAHMDAWGAIPTQISDAGITKESNPDLFNVLDKVANRKKVTRAEVVAVFGGEKKAKKTSAIMTALSALGLGEMEEGEVDEGMLLAPKGLERIDVGFPDNLDKIGTKDYNNLGPKEKAQIEDGYKTFKDNLKPAPATVAPTPAPAPAPTLEPEKTDDDMIAEKLDKIKKGDDGKWFDENGDTISVAQVEGLVNGLSAKSSLREVWADKLADSPAAGGEQKKLRGKGKKKATAPSDGKKGPLTRSQSGATATATGTTDATPDAIATAAPAAPAAPADEEEKEDEAPAEPEQPPTVDVVPPPTVPAGPAEFTQDLPPVVNIPDEGPTTLPPGLRQEFIQEGDRSAPADLQTGMGGIGETIAQLNDKEQRDVMKMKLPEIKKRIEALHIAYDSLIPEFKANPHTKAKNDALRTKDLKVARKHLIKMLQRVQAYYDANTALKVGVIVPANILMRQMFENQSMMQNPMMIQQQQQPMLQQEQQQTIEDEGGDSGEDQRRRLMDFQTFLQNPTVQTLSDNIMGRLAQMGQKQLDSALKNAQKGVKDSIMKRLEGYTGGGSTDPPITDPNDPRVEEAIRKEERSQVAESMANLYNIKQEQALKIVDLYSRGFRFVDMSTLESPDGKVRLNIDNTDTKTFNSVKTSYNIDNTVNVQNVAQQLNVYYGRAAGGGGGGSGGIPMGAAAGMGMGGGMGMGASTVNQNVKPHAGDTLHVKGDKFGHAMSVSTYYRNSGMEAFQRRGVARHSITPQPERRTRFNIVKDPRPLPNVPAPAIGVLNNRSRGKPTGFKIRT